MTVDHHMSGVWRLASGVLLLAATCLSCVHAAIAATAIPAATATAPGWLPDIAAGLEKSKVDGRDVLVFYNGSDWCRAGVRFKSSVLASPAFAAAAGRFVLVEVDHPNLMTKEQREQDKKRNGMLEVRIDQYPTLVLADREGRAFGRIACAGITDPATVVRSLDALVAARTARDKAWAEADKTQGVEQAKLLGKGLEAIADECVRTKPWRGVLDRLKKADPEDRTGYNARYHFRLNEVMEKTVWRLADGKKHDEADKAIQRLLTNDKLTTLQRQELTAARFALFNRWKKTDDAIAQLDRLITLDPKSDMAAGALVYRDYLRRKPIPVTRWWNGAICGEPAVWSRESPEIAGIGTWQVVFRQTSGDNRLEIAQVDLLVDGKIVAASAKKIKADQNGAAVDLAVPALPAGAKPVLHITTRCGGWRSTAGEIIVRRKDGP